MKRLLALVFALTIVFLGGKHGLMRGVKAASGGEIEELKARIEALRRSGVPR
jgi:hypothetical protein